VARKRMIRLSPRVGIQRGKIKEEELVVSQETLHPNTPLLLEPNTRLKIDLRILNPKSSNLTKMPMKRWFLMILMILVPKNPKTKSLIVDINRL
jgi:hypothetical protein